MSDWVPLGAPGPFTKRLLAIGKQLAIDAAEAGSDTRDFEFKADPAVYAEAMLELGDHAGHQITLWGLPFSASADVPPGEIVLVPRDHGALTNPEPV